MFIDVLSAIIISLGFYLGYQRGLIKTIFDTLSLIIGILAALKLSPVVIGILESIFKINPAINFILGIALTFVGVMYGIRFIGRKIEQLLEVIHINFINKFAGGAIQALFFAAILSFTVGLVDKVKLVSPETKAVSFSYPYLMKVPSISEKALVIMRPIFSGFWDKALETIDAMKKKENK